MVQRFKQRHLMGEVIAAPISFIDGRLAAVYGRISCDNSKMSSVLDQVTNCIRKAAGLGLVVPWDRVFADYQSQGTCQEVQRQSADDSALC